MVSGKETNTQSTYNSPWSWHLLQETLWRKGQMLVVKCHSVIIFAVPEQILEVASDLMEKYCILEKALHTMLGQLCLPLMKWNTSKAQMTTDIRNPALPLILTKARISFSYALVFTWRSAQHMLWKELGVQSPPWTMMWSLWRGQNHSEFPLVQSSRCNLSIKLASQDCHDCKVLDFLLLPRMLWWRINYRH